MIVNMFLFIFPDFFFDILKMMFCDCCVSVALVKCYVLFSCKVISLSTLD